MDILKESDMSSSRRVTRSMVISATPTVALHDRKVLNDTERSKSRVSAKGSSGAINRVSKVRVKARAGAESQAGQSRHDFPSKDATSFGLIQESIAHNLYHLCIQAMLWNQTSGKQARPVFFRMIELYPTPSELAKASLSDLTALLQPLGLHNIRARRCILFAEKWLEAPPVAGRTYIRKGYPSRGEEEGYEIAHLPGMGPYAIDSFRMFHRDEMRGLADDWLGAGCASTNFESEWMRVVPLDKELKAYVKWQRYKQGYDVVEADQAEVTS